MDAIQRTPNAASDAGRVVATRPLAGREIGDGTARAMIERVVEGELLTKAQRQTAVDETEWKRWHVVRSPDQTTVPRAATRSAVAAYLSCSGPCIAPPSIGIDLYV